MHTHTHTHASTTSNIANTQNRKGHTANKNMRNNMNSDWFWLCVYWRELLIVVVFSCGLYMCCVLVCFQCGCVVCACVSFLVSMASAARNQFNSNNSSPIGFAIYNQVRISISNKHNYNTSTVTYTRALPHLHTTCNMYTYIRIPLQRHEFDDRCCALPCVCRVLVCCWFQCFLLVCYVLVLCLCLWIDWWWSSFHLWSWKWW